MLPKAYRLPLRHLPEFFSRSQRIFFGGNVIYFAAAEGNTRAAVVVSKKSVALSTERNALKRQVRALITPLLPLYPGKQFVVVIRKKMDSQQFTHLQQKIEAMLRS